MAVFYNQASLSYGGVTAASNRTEGVLLNGAAFNKIAVSSAYVSGGRVVYAVGVTNDTDADLTGLSLTDDLGAYEFNGETRYPLSYVQGSLRFFLNGVLQPTERIAVTPGPPMEITGLTLPAGSNAVLLYEAETTVYAPLGENAQIGNTATLTGGSMPLTATAYVPAADAAQLGISKLMTPDQVAEGEELTYTFVLQNTGAAATEAADALTVTDVFTPPLQALSVALDGAALIEGQDYTYDPATGVFATVPGRIAVPAATFEQTPDGAWTATPGAAVLSVTGTI